jgi:hypothetical protein
MFNKHIGLSCLMLFGEPVANGTLLLGMSWFTTLYTLARYPVHMGCLVHICTWPILAIQGASDGSCNIYTLAPPHLSLLCEFIFRKGLRVPLLSQRQDTTWPRATGAGTTSSPGAASVVARRASARALSGHLLPRAPPPCGPNAAASRTACRGRSASVLARRASVLAGRCHRSDAARAVAPGHRPTAPRSARSCHALRRRAGAGSARRGGARRGQR